MISSALVVSALIGMVSAGSVGLGGQCQTDADCATGVQCYAVNSMQIRTCGSFQAQCTSDSQCATNACNNGFCNGALKTSSSSAPAPSSSNAPGTVALGKQCNPNNPGECAYGSSCYAVNSMQIPTCGNFQATCTSNAQCATNLCTNGLCGGQPVAGASKLGQPCSPNIPYTCQNSQCYAGNFMQIPVCGNLGATCTDDYQCAFNTCSGGICSGLRSSSSGGVIPTTTTPATGIGSTSAARTSAATATVTTSPCGCPGVTSVSITTSVRPTNATTTTATRTPVVTVSGGVRLAIAGHIICCMALALAFVL